MAKMSEVKPYVLGEFRIELLRLAKGLVDNGLPGHRVVIEVCLHIIYA